MVKQYLRLHVSEVTQLVDNSLQHVRCGRFTTMHATRQKYHRPVLSYGLLGRYRHHVYRSILKRLRYFDIRKVNALLLNSTIVLGNLAVYFVKRVLHVLIGVRINVRDDNVVGLLDFVADQVMKHGFGSLLTLVVVSLTDHALPFLAEPRRLARRQLLKLGLAAFEVHRHVTIAQELRLITEILHMETQDARLHIFLLNDLVELLYCGRNASKGEKHTGPASGHFR